MNSKILSLFFKIAFLTTLVSVSAMKSECERSRKRDLKDLYTIYEAACIDDPTLAAGFMRMGFHDCITARPDNPKSGCNGSVQYETNHPFNGRLKRPVAAMLEKKAGFSCISVADAVMVAYAASVGASFRGNILKDVVDFNYENRRIDTAEGEGDFFNGDQLTLPIAEDLSWANQVAFYKSKLLTEEDLVVSLVVGHSIGSFTEVDENIVPTGRILNFTELSPDKANADYCGALLVQHDFEMTGNLPTFNFLASDLSLTRDPAGVHLLNMMCSYSIERRDNFKLQFDETKAFVKESFTRFSVKMASLTGAKLAAADLTV